MRILLPSTLTRALDALGLVLGASDVDEYLDQFDALALEHAQRVLIRTRSTAILTCEDPAHERQVIALARARLRAHRAWLREVRLEKRRSMRRARVGPARRPQRPSNGGGGTGATT